MRVGGGLLLLLFVVALLGPPLASYSPSEQDRDCVYGAPSTQDCAGRPHWLGTDSLGRDVLSRTVHAARTSVLTAAAGSVLTIFLGTLFGAAAGLYGGLWDRVLMRSTELFTVLPALYLILALRNLFPDDLSTWGTVGIIVVSLSAVGWASVARLVRGQVLTIRELDYVSAARAAGAPRWRILRAHVLPSLRPFILLQLGLVLPYFFVGEVTLSFLGLGITEPDPSFGNMLAASASSVSLLGARWWTWLAPATLLTIAILGANLWLEGMRERYFSDSRRSSTAAARSWASFASRLWISSTWGSKHLRQRAS